MRQGAAERWTNRRRLGNVASRQWVHAGVRLRGGRQIACAVARWLRLFGNPACRVRHRHLVPGYEVPASIGTMPACSGLMRRSGWACEARQVLAVRGKMLGFLASPQPTHAAASRRKLRVGRHLPCPHLISRSGGNCHTAKNARARCPFAFFLPLCALRLWSARADGANRGDLNRARSGRTIGKPRCLSCVARIGFRHR